MPGSLAALGTCVAPPSAVAALVYLETSVISYLTAWPSGDVIVAGRQQLTQGVVEPASRLFRRGGLGACAEALALALLKDAALPAKARADALHIAIAATQGVSCLLTWNSAPIANAEKRPRVEPYVASPATSRPFYVHPTSSWERSPRMSIPREESQTPWVDPIVAEVRAARERTVEAAGGDLHRQVAAGRNPVRHAPRPRSGTGRAA